VFPYKSGSLDTIFAAGAILGLPKVEKFSWTLVLAFSFLSSEQFDSLHKIEALLHIHQTDTIQITNLPAIHRRYTYFVYLCKVKFKEKGIIMEYTIIIKKDKKSGWYVGKCVQVPGAMSQGETVDELMENMKDAITTILECYKEEAKESFNNTGIFYRKLAFA